MLTPFDFALYSFGLYLFLPALKPLFNLHPQNRWRKLWTKTGIYTKDPDTNKTNYPRLIKTKQTPTGKAVTFVLPTGLAPENLDHALPAIEYEFTCTPIIDTNKKEVTIYLNTLTLPKILEYISQELTGTLPFYIGDSMTGPILLDLAKLPHLLIGGTTGGGKTYLLKLILSYIIRSKNAIIYAADMARTDLSFTQDYGAIFIPDPAGLQIVIDELHTELFTRLAMLESSKCENLFEYNEKNPNNQKQRIVLTIDELAVFRPRPGMDKEEKTSLLNSFGQLIDLASVGRKTGIHLILCTQQPNSEVIPALLRDNIPCRIAFKCATRWQSDSILQSTSALYLPVNPGRCILQHGEETQIQVPNYNKEVMTAELAAYRL